MENLSYSIRLMLRIRFAKMKLIGKKAKTRFINKIESIENFFLFKLVRPSNIWEL